MNNFFDVILDKWYGFLYFLRDISYSISDHKLISLIVFFTFLWAGYASYNYVLPAFQNTEDTQNEIVMQEEIIPEENISENPEQTPENISASGSSQDLNSQENNIENPWESNPYNSENTTNNSNNTTENNPNSSGNSLPSNNNNTPANNSQNTSTIPNNQNIETDETEREASQEQPQSPKDLLTQALQEKFIEETQKPINTEVSEDKKQVVWNTQAWENTTPTQESNNQGNTNTGTSGGTTSGGTTTGGTTSGGTTSGGTSSGGTTSGGTTSGGTTSGGSNSWNTGMTWEANTWSSGWTTTNDENTSNETLPPENTNQNGGSNGTTAWNTWADWNPVETHVDDYQNNSATFNTGEKDVPIKVVAVHSRIPIEPIAGSCPSGYYMFGINSNIYDNTTLSLPYTQNGNNMTLTNEFIKKGGSDYYFKIFNVNGTKIGWVIYKIGNPDFDYHWSFSICLQE